MGFLLKIVGITALAGMGGTGAGGLLACLFRRDSGKTVSLLLSFAAGVMTSVVCFDLLGDAIHPEGGAAGPGLPVVIAGVMTGYGTVAALNAWINRREPAVSPGNSRNGRKGRRGQRSLLGAGLVMAAAIALHNVPEGMVIGASFARACGAELINRSGLTMALVIGLHNVPEGMAVAVPLISGGMGKIGAAGMAAVTGGPTILGALLGYRIGTMGPGALSLSLSFASGAMLYVVFGELLPESTRMWRSGLPALAAIVGMMTGLLIVCG